jgi:pyruvate dehydrogenase E1 component alpha subunit
VWDLPVVYVCENNEFAESTPRWQHQRVKDIAVRAQSYDIPGLIVDGNDVEAVYLTAGEAIERARSGGGPTLIEAKTTRWRGHHEADNQSYRDKDEFQAALENDAIERWKEQLLARGFSQAKLDAINAKVAQELEDAIEFAEQSPHPDPADARADIFTPFEWEAV